MSTIDNVAEAIQICESRPGINNAEWHQISTWEADEGYVCRNFTDNVAFDRHSKVAQGERNDVTRNGVGGSNYIFMHGHAKHWKWANTWHRIGPDVVKGGQTVTPTPWRQNFSGWDDRCNYRVP